MFNTKFDRAMDKVLHGQLTQHDLVGIDDIDAKYRTSGKTLLFYSCIEETFYTNHGNVVNNVEFLLKNGADPNFTDEDGQTPLFYLIASYNELFKEQFEDIFELLLDYGADINARTKPDKFTGNYNGYTLLMSAVLMSGEDGLNSSKVVQMLLDKGAKYNRSEMFSMIYKTSNVRKFNYKVYRLFNL